MMLPMPSNTTTKGNVRSTHQVFTIDFPEKRQELFAVGEGPLTPKVDGNDIQNH
jgi:hypothetical protein